MSVKLGYLACASMETWVRFTFIDFFLTVLPLVASKAVTAIVIDQILGEGGTESLSHMCERERRCVMTDIAGGPILAGHYEALINFLIALWTSVARSTTTCESAKRVLN